MQPDTSLPHSSPGDLTDPPYRGDLPLQLIPEALSHQAYLAEPHHQHQQDLWGQIMQRIYT